MRLEGCSWLDWLARGHFATLTANLSAALKAAGYPTKADPAKVDKLMIVVILTYLVILVTMVYGPIAAMLVELFPTRIRYTSMSLPYHIGNGWFGGFLPTTAFAMVAATGNIYYGLWYPIVIAIATDSVLPQPTGLPVLDINDSEAHADWLLAQGERLTYDASQYAC